MTLRTLLGAAAVAFAVLFTAPAAAEPMLVKPADAAKDDPELAALFDTLLKAAAAKDFAPFEAAMTKDAVASFGGDEGPEGFKRAYGIGEPDSPFWAEFTGAVELGAIFVEPELVYAPYIAGGLPEAADPYLSIVAIGPKTELYKEPSEGAAVVADVTHQVLEQIDIEPEDLAKTPEGWVHVKADAGAGYVKAAETRSALDYRAVFQKIDGKWRLTAFVAGD